MTKQEKIKEAYGEYFEAVKDYVDENGYCYAYFNLAGSFKQDVFFDSGLIAKWRPKPLAGLEHNNGWIKIESEDDLPKIDFITQYWFFDGASTWISTFTLEMKLGRVKITHYQPIIKPKPPIY